MTARSLVRENGLGLVTFVLFVIFVVAMSLSGLQAYNADQLEHAGHAVSLGAYLAEGHFWEALFENWESEFLQMAAYVVLTVFFVQKGSAESKDPDRRERVDDEPGDVDRRRAGLPWPVRRGGIWLKVYEHSLLIAFVLLFVASIVGHALGGADSYNDELREHGHPTVGTLGYATSAQFWFESFQNWQSEFLAVFSIVVLSIFLRQRGSPESKAVIASHSTTGSP